MKANYHCHTPLCHHAKGTLAEYGQAALDGGFDTLGISDHTPFHYESGFQPWMRMREEQLAQYVLDVRAAAADFQGRLRMLCGLECEYFPDHFQWLLEQKEKFRLDYLLLGNHFDSTDEHTENAFGQTTTPQKLRRYVEMTIRGMETGAFLYLAHPDLCFAQYAAFDENAKAASKDLCLAALENHLPLEYNLHGLRSLRAGAFQGLGYPCHRFWEIAAACGNPCIIGVDAHEPEEMEAVNAYQYGTQFLSTLGMQPLSHLL